MPISPNIFIVDDDPYICKILQKALEISGFRSNSTTNSTLAIEMILESKPDLILLDISMPGLDGLEVLEAIKNNGINVPVIMMTGFSSMETTVKAIRLGAKDYLTKPLDIINIDKILSRWIEEHHSQSLKLTNPRAEASSTHFEMIGSSAGMIEVYKVIGAVSKTPNSTNVLILGESGTGKELVARQVHDYGDHASSPYIPLNMTALTDTLIESELFGYEKGAFTGANQQKAGQFELAKDGTIFLDEIGGISLNLQQKLLRVLQEREFRRVGGQKALPLHCRIIAATNADLATQTKTGEFRSDLFHRLNVINIKIPPLRDRIDDIPRLAEHFITEKCRELNRPLPSLGNQTISLLCEYDWPGNVRELKNAISRALILNRSDVLRESDFADLHEPDETTVVASSISDLATARKEYLEKFEKNYIVEMLKQNNGNVALAAGMAKVTVQRYYEMMRKYHVKAEDCR